MPRYRILVEGRGLDAATYRGPPIRGFFVTRVVEAASAEAAKAAVLAAVERDWKEGKFARWRQSPAIAAVEVEEVGLLGRHLLRSKDYIFHRGR